MSDRLRRHEDPLVRQSAELIARSVDRAVRMCQQTLEVGSAREAGVSDETVDAILHGFELRDPRYRHLVEVTRRLMSESGCLGQAEVTLFEEKGVPFDELLEIIAAFTLATYANNLARTRIDPEYR